MENHTVTYKQDNTKTIISVNPQDGMAGMDISLTFINGSGDEVMSLFNTMYNTISRGVMEGCADLLNTIDISSNIVSFKTNDKKSMFNKINSEDILYDYPRICTYVSYLMCGRTKYNSDKYYSLGKDIKLTCGIRISNNQYIIPNHYKYINQWPIVPMKIVDLIMKEMVPVFLNGKPKNRIAHRSVYNTRGVLNFDNRIKKSNYYRYTSFEAERSRSWWHKGRFSSYFSDEDLLNNSMFVKYKFLGDLEKNI